MDGSLNNRWRDGLLLALVSLLPSLAAAQSVTIPDEYSKLIKHSGEITVFGNEGFGDKIDLASGGLEIIQTDIDLPGTNALPVRLARRFVPGDKYAGGFIGVWDLDIPYLHGIFANHVYNPRGWTVPDGGTGYYSRCSQFAAPPDMYFQGGHYLADEYWHGSFLHLPGAGDQELLQGTPRVPADGKTYPVVTKAGSVARCVGLAASSESGSQGEGFEIVTPEGLTYTLNQMVSRPNQMIAKPVMQMGLAGVSGAVPARHGNASGGTDHPSLAMNFTLPRVEVRIYPTKVADRFGNAVIYTWNASNPGQLLQMAASDGRKITFTYSSSGVTASDGSRVWTYSQNAGAETVALPDGSTWVSNLGALSNYKIVGLGDGCEWSDAGSSGPTGSSAIGSITAPSGASIVYTMAPVVMGRSWVPRECIYDLDSGYPSYAVEPAGYLNFAIISKNITGPGLPASGALWAYGYGPNNGCFVYGGSPCTASSPTTRSMTVTAPDGVVNRYTFGNRFAVNEGLLLRIDEGWNGTSAARTVETTYADPNAAPYAVFSGSSIRQRGDTLISSDVMPKRQITTTQQGRTFTWKVASDCSGVPYCFDTFGRPTKIIKTSTP
ncbi:hypothetical protein [Thermomonas sp.]|uniref:hypothetical protein n=1 Tax=Thermomonas sp. TaxID=1971895 RepID=UPI0023976D8B|nr:hypothetical protein [Xanthomonadaceae bacterium]